MKLYRAKVPAIAKDIVTRLVSDGDIEVVGDNKEEAEQDYVAIMEEYLRRDSDLRNHIRDHMAQRNLPYNQYGRTRSRVAEEWGHPLGDDVERFLARQMVENLMISRWIDEVYEEDRVIYKKVIEILRSHNVDERSIREEAATKVKNVREGTVEYEIALQKAVKDEKKRRGLI